MPILWSHVHKDITFSAYSGESSLPTRNFSLVQSVYISCNVYNTPAKSTMWIVRLAARGSIYKEVYADGARAITSIIPCFRCTHVYVCVSLIILAKPISRQDTAFINQTSAASLFYVHTSIFQQQFTNYTIFFYTAYRGKKATAISLRPKTSSRARILERRQHSSLRNVQFI